MVKEQRDMLFAALKGLGRNNLHPKPNYRNHWRIRLDGKAMIFEGDFNDEDWTVDSMTNWLSQVFEVNPHTISASLASTGYGPMATFIRNGAKMRMIAFGGLLTSWQESHLKALAYLKANKLEWEIFEEP